MAVIRRPSNDIYECDECGDKIVSTRLPKGWSKKGKKLTCPNCLNTKEDIPIE